MNNTTLEILNLLGSQFDINTIIPLLVKYKYSGGAKDLIYKEVYGMRTNFSIDSLQDDQILEVLDVISGWCPQHLRVWK